MEPTAWSSTVSYPTWPVASTANSIIGLPSLQARLAEARTTFRLSATVDTTSAECNPNTVPRTGGNTHLSGVFISGPACEPQVCDIMVDKTCLVAPPANGELLCTDSIAATTLRYTGPTILNATVTFAGKDHGLAVGTAAVTSTSPGAERSTTTTSEALVKWTSTLAARMS